MKKGCSYCKKVFEIKYDIKDYKWKVDDLYQCSYSCYSKEFDKRYKASKFNIYGGSNDRCTKDRKVDRGYER